MRTVLKTGNVCAKIQLLSVYRSGYFKEIVVAFNVMPTLDYCRQKHHSREQSLIGR